MFQQAKVAVIRLSMTKIKRKIYSCNYQSEIFNIGDII